MSKLVSTNALLMYVSCAVVAVRLSIALTHGLRCFATVAGIIYLDIDPPVGANVVVVSARHNLMVKHHGQLRSMDGSEIIHHAVLQVIPDPPVVIIPQPVIVIDLTDLIDSEEESEDEFVNLPEDA